jgi:hypothetical protein
MSQSIKRGPSGYPDNVQTLTQKPDPKYRIFSQTRDHLDDVTFYVSLYTSLSPCARKSTIPG